MAGRRPISAQASLSNSSSGEHRKSLQVRQRVATSESEVQHVGVTVQRDVERHAVHRDGDRIGSLQTASVEVQRLSWPWDIADAQVEGEWQRPGDPGHRAGELQRRRSQQGRAVGNHLGRGHGLQLPFRRLGRGGDRLQPRDRVGDVGAHGDQYRARSRGTWSRSWSTPSSGSSGLNIFTTESKSCAQAWRITSAASYLVCRWGRTCAIPTTPKPTKTTWFW